ncbi:hypothetical protein IF2G_08029 [Cordyceps javanica]|nr:hypothetical protein IF2G_08029 [Cordyceps javanica]
MTTSPLPPLGCPSPGACHLIRGPRSPQPRAANVLGAHRVARLVAVGVDPVGAALAVVDAHRVRAGADGKGRAAVVVDEKLLAVARAPPPDVAVPEELRPAAEHVEAEAAVRAVALVAPRARRQGGRVGVGVAGGRVAGGRPLNGRGQHLDGEHQPGRALDQCAFHRSCLVRVRLTTDGAAGLCTIARRPKEKKRLGCRERRGRCGCLRK